MPNVKGPNDHPTEQTLSTADLIDQLIVELKRLRETRRAAREHKSNPSAATLTEDDVRLHPGSTRGEMARRTRLHPRTVSKAVAELAARGTVVRIGESRAARWFHVETLNELRRTAWERRKSSAAEDAETGHEARTEH